MTQRHHLSSPNTNQLSINHLDLVALGQSARLTLRILATLDLGELRFRDRQRLARLLVRLEKVAGDVHELITLPR